MSQPRTEAAKTHEDITPSHWNLLGRFHGGYVYRRRVRILAELLAARLPPAAEVLDVGSGDGLIASIIQSQRPDIGIRGIEVFLRPENFIKIDSFDGETIPFADASFDVVMLVDVLHHASDPLALLQEARRVTRKTILIKDHSADGPAARSVLRVMDWVGGARHGFPLPYNYWSSVEWTKAAETLGVTIRSRESKLSLYPWPASWLFDSSLHFIAEWETS